MSTLTAIQKTLQAQANAKTIKIEPNSADTSLVESREIGVLIQGSNATVKNSPEAGGVTLIGGEPNRESIEGGDITLQGGHQTLSQSTSQAGNVNIFSGDGYLGGDVWIVGGDNLDNSASSLTGSITIQTGGQDLNSVTNTGAILINTGNTRGAYESGSFTLKTGTTDNTANGTEVTSGSVTIETGGFDLANSHKTGAGYNVTGSISLKTGNTPDRNSGAITVETGESSLTTSGGLTLSSGVASNTLQGGSGDTTLRSGASNFNPGDVSIYAGDMLGGAISGGFSGNVTIHGSNRPNGASNLSRAGNVNINSGIVNGVSSFGAAGSYGGNVNINAYGFGGFKSNSYLATIETFEGGVFLYSGGSVYLKTKSDNTGESGLIDIFTSASIVGDSGDITIRSQSSNVTSGTHTSGNLSLTTGDGTGSASGDLALTTGQANKDANNVIYASGNITLTTGDTNDDAVSGDIELTTGNSGGSSATGGINVTTGTPTSGTSGTINISTGDKQSEVTGGLINIEAGDSYAEVYTAAGGTTPFAPSIYVKAGSHKGSTASSTALKGGLVTIQGGDADQIMTVAGSQWKGGDVRIYGGVGSRGFGAGEDGEHGDIYLTGHNLNIISNSSGGSTNDDGVLSLETFGGDLEIATGGGEAKVVSGSLPTDIYPNRLVFSQGDTGVLGKLEDGLQILGYGEITLTTTNNVTLDPFFIYHIPISFRGTEADPFRINGNANSIQVGIDNDSSWFASGTPGAGDSNFSSITEWYKGAPIFDPTAGDLTGSGAPALRAPNANPFHSYIESIQESTLSRYVAPKLTVQYEIVSDRADTFGTQVTETGRAVLNTSALKYVQQDGTEKITGVYQNRYIMMMRWAGGASGEWYVLSLNGGGSRSHDFANHLYIPAENQEVKIRYRVMQGL